MKPKAKESPEIKVNFEVHEGSVDVHVIGTAPIVLNRMSEKAKHQLLLPPKKMTQYDKDTNLKHNPMQEFQAAAYKRADGPTLLAVPSTAFKGALSTAALDIPGTKKAQIARLSFVKGEFVPVYGIPKIYLAIVRNSDMNRTPDVRTRVAISEWAAKFTVNFVEPLLNPQTILKLLGGAGLYVGVGDGRPEKGKLSFGRFTVVEKDSSDFNRLVKSAGRKQQEIAMKNPEPYDEETREMLSWFDEEIKRRNFEKGHPRKAKSNGKVNGHAFPTPDEAHTEESFQ